MDRIGVVRASGLVAVTVTMVAILVATLVSPAFRWTGNALSNLGVAATAAGMNLTVLLFNGGLIVGGLAGDAQCRRLDRLGTDWVSDATGACDPGDHRRARAFDLGGSGLGRADSGSVGTANSISSRHSLAGPNASSRDSRVDEAIR